MEMSDDRCIDIKPQENVKHNGCRLLAKIVSAKNIKVYTQ